MHPIYFEYPNQVLDDATIELPAGWHVSSVPLAQNTDASALQYSLKVDNDNGVLYVGRRLSVNILILDAKYYAALRKFFQTVRSGDEEQVLLQPGGECRKQLVAEGCGGSR